MPDRRLYLLGAPRATRDGALLDLPPAKALALLAYLALSRTPPTREAVQALLWPESFAEAARKNLRNTLWAIRKGLGDDLLRAEDDRLALAADAWVDVGEFERQAQPPLNEAPESRAAAIARLTAAVDLYGGSLLDGVAVGEAPE